MRKVGTFFLKFFTGIFIALIVLQACQDKEAGGYGMNGVLAFFLIIGLCFVLIKFRAIWALILTDIFCLIMLNMFDGGEAFGTAVGVSFFLTVAVPYIEHRWTVNEHVQNQRSQGKECCPYCGSTRVHYEQGHTELYNGTQDYWDPYAGPDRYQGQWRRESVVKSKHIKGNWKFDNCGRTF